tara:strand:- start:4121 stop:5002 length:882 start_codon:yes stop_codon:yes gene_type:complete
MQKSQDLKFNLLILGCNGLAGNTFYRYFSRNSNFNVFGTVRKKKYINLFDKKIRKNIMLFNSFSRDDKLRQLLTSKNYNYIINCVGITKKKKVDYKLINFINAVLPFKISKLKNYKTKLVHLSTDCVFNGSKGNYIETDVSDAEDIYGITKILGEVQSRNTITIRTSIIGHEITLPKLGLMEWFFNMKKVKGFFKAYFSGITVLQFAKILEKTNFFKGYTGIRHISSKKISKYDLLNIIKTIYKKKIIVNKSSNLIIDRSLNSTKFKRLLKLKIPNWSDMIKETYEFEMNETK